MRQVVPASELDLEALEARVTRFLGNAPVAEATGAKLSQVLRAFLQHEVLPQTDRAAGLGLDPTPMLAVVADLLRLYADALEHRQPIDR